MAGGAATVAFPDFIVPGLTSHCPAGKRGPWAPRNGRHIQTVRRHGPSRLAAMDADALSTTPAAQAALQALRAAAGANGPMERHCLRQFAIAERLAGDRAFDRELLLCACWLHDAGLYIPSRDPYVTEGARLADREPA